MATQQKFNLQEQMQKALEWLLENRWERLDGSKWLSASDLQSRLRCAVAEIAEGRKYGHYGFNSAYMSPRITGLNGISLLEHCRRFLFNQVSAGKLSCNNPRGRTSTGMRFRPVGEELSEAEKRTLAIPREERNKRVSHLKHVETKTYSREDGTSDSYKVEKAECQKTRKKGYSFRSRYVWYNNEKPTCKKCQAILAKRAGLDIGTPIEIIRDRLEELGLTGANA